MWCHFTRTFCLLRKVGIFMSLLKASGSLLKGFIIFF
nr:MAG TPA: hypothetical protein [Caudoviricetes sp.]